MSMVTVVASYAQNCNCPQSSACRACEGDLISITLQYNGTVDAVIAANDAVRVTFTRFIRVGQIFTVGGSTSGQPFAGNFVRLIGVGLITQINQTIQTACQSGIEVGDVYGPFKVVAAISKDGGALCCAASDIDTEPPVISSCPSDIITSTNPALCTALVTWTEPVVTDDCDVTLTSNILSGSQFPVGITEVSYTAKDQYGNTSSCTFSVTVEDRSNPGFDNCIVGNVVKKAFAGQCEAMVTWPDPLPKDNCSVNTTSNYASGDVFPLGKTTVIYNSADPAGNTASCSFEVWVSVGQKLQFTNCPSDIVVDITDGTACLKTVSWVEPLINAACNLDIQQSHSPGDAFNLGTTIVSYQVADPTDPANSATCTFNVIVVDKAPPVFDQCPTDIVISAGTDCMATVEWVGPVAIDNCSVSQVESNYTSGSVLPIGLTEVVYTATDAAGNVANCQFNIDVVDASAPVFSNCPQSIVLIADENCEAMAIWEEPSAIDYCNTFDITASHQPGTVFRVGLHSIVYTATDAKGNTSNCQFDVIVRNIDMPVIENCPEDIAVEVLVDNTVAVYWEEPTANAFCGTVILEANYRPGDQFVVGTTQVEYIFTDEAQMETRCYFDVTVSLITVQVDPKPVVTPNGDGNNDSWVIKDIEKYNDNEVIILDRWGGEIFRVQKYDNDRQKWDGRNKGGDMVPFGTYFYFITIHSAQGKYEKNGFIEVVR